MILTEKLLTKLAGTQGNYYNKLGYNCKNGDIIEINIKDLPKGSHTKVNVKCDICGNEKELIYKQYNNNISKYNLYSCSEKCANFKNKLTCKEKYGEENYNNRESAEETCLKVYGVSSSNKLEGKKEKAKNTCIERYGAKSPTENKQVFEKVKKTNLERYGIENIGKVEKFKEKSKKTCLEKYGHEFIFKTDLFKGKSKNTMLERYGVEFTNQSKELKIKSEITRIKNGNQLTTEEKNLFLIYSRRVEHLTKIKKDFFLQNWDGYDYYDGEYIKDNFVLHPNNKLYPTIDHKISVYYGFHNNILPEELSDLSNLCVTKRSINSLKNKKTEYEFKFS